MSLRRASVRSLPAREWLGSRASCPKKAQECYRPAVGRPRRAKLSGCIVGEADGRFRSDHFHINILFAARTPPSHENATWVPSGEKLGLRSYPG